jgi:hypothetical protein
MARSAPKPKPDDPRSGSQLQSHVISQTSRNGNQDSDSEFSPVEEMFDSSSPYYVVLSAVSRLDISGTPSSYSQGIPAGKSNFHSTSDMLHGLVLSATSRHGDKLMYNPGQCSPLVDMDVHVVLGIFWVSFVSVLPLASPPFVFLKPLSLRAPASSTAPAALSESLLFCPSPASPSLASPSLASLSRGSLSLAILSLSPLPIFSGPYPSLNHPYLLVIAPSRGIDLVFCDF